MRNEIDMTIRNGNIVIPRKSNRKAWAENFFQKSSRGFSTITVRSPYERRAAARRIATKFA